MLHFFFLLLWKKKNALAHTSLGEIASLESTVRREVAGHSLVKHMKQMGASWTSGQEKLPCPLLHVNKKATVTAFAKLCSGRAEVQ